MALSLAIGTYPVGVAPNAIASDPTNKFLYVTDGAANQMVGFLIQTNGTLLNMQLPFKTDNLPDAVQVDPRGIYVYVANYNANDVSAYTIDRGTGNATQISGATTYAVDTGPICILIEPAEARYVYTANFLGNTVSGLAPRILRLERSPGYRTRRSKQLDSPPVQLPSHMATMRSRWCSRSPDRGKDRASSPSPATLSSILICPWWEELGESRLQGTPLRRSMRSVADAG